MNVTVVCSSTTINITCGECSKIALFKTVREISPPGKGIAVIVTNALILVVGIMQVRMRIRYAVSKKHSVHFDYTSRHQRFTQKKRVQSIWVPSTILNQPPLEQNNRPYSHLISRVCGADLRYIFYRYACALDLLK